MSGGVGGILVYLTGTLALYWSTPSLLFQYNADAPGAKGYDPFEPVIVTVYLVGATVMLARLRVDRA